MSTIGSRIRERRIFVKMTQDELAVKAGYKSRSSINKIEIGERGVSADKLKKVADALGTSVDYLIGEKKNPYPKGTIGYMLGDSFNKDYKSNKGQKIICKIDTELYNQICAFAEENDRTFEDEMEYILHCAVESELEDRANRGQQNEFY